MPGSERIELPPRNKEGRSSPIGGNQGVPSFFRWVDRSPRRYAVPPNSPQFGQDIRYVNLRPERFIGYEAPESAQEKPQFWESSHVPYTSRNMAYEIEIKSLLGEEEHAERLKEAMRALDPSLSLRSSYTQLNHYFEGGNLDALVEALAPHVPAGTLEQMRTIAAEGTNVSVRTREMNGEARIVMKASIGDDSSENGVARLEIEEPVALSLTALDELVLSAGFTYQAKWSRTREEYALGDVAVCLDKNAGYGYLVEFEKVVEDPSHAEATKTELASLMGRLGVAELPQDRLERMFSYYNAHWPEYYGTEKVFVIE